MGESKSVKELILLVGSNPMPNFLSVLMFKPKKVWFCYTAETEKVKERLKSVLENIYSFESKEVYISDAGDPKTVRKAFRLEKEINKNTYLNYTGGTKVMAAQARMFFKEEFEGKDSHAFYIYDRDRIIRFDNGKTILFENTNLKLRIDDILLLHNIEIENEKFLTKEEINLSREIASFILKSEEKDIAQNKKEETLKRKFKEKYPEIPEFFRRGDWLEIWTGNIIKNLISDDPNSSIHIALNCKRENRSFEIDIATIYKHRIYIISCTTSHKLERCKVKLFEIASRARQLGGDLARSALVCLLHGEDKKGAYIDQLKKDIKDLWDAPNTPRVFGLDDLREWIEGRLNSLKEWLES